MENCITLFCSITSALVTCGQVRRSEDCVLVALSTMLGVNLELGFICSQGHQQEGLSSFHFISEISLTIA